MNRPSVTACVCRARPADPGTLAHLLFKERGSLRSEPDGSATSLLPPTVPRGPSRLTASLQRLTGCANLKRDRTHSVSAGQSTALDQIFLTPPS